MSPKTIAELDLRRAQLVAQAERLRATQRGTLTTSHRFTALGRQIRDVQAQADDYARILDFVKSKEG